MLLIARYEGESLYIYPDESIDPSTPIGEVFTYPVQVKIDKLQAGQVKIAVDGPKGLKILREELIDD